MFSTKPVSQAVPTAATAGGEIVEAARNVLGWRSVVVETLGGIAHDPRKFREIVDDSECSSETKKEVSGMMVSYTTQPGIG